ncbi:MAG: CHAT domain-containing tetratricopeptide repeat protein, partial [Acidobacteriota bacterium]
AVVLHRAAGDRMLLARTASNLGLAYVTRGEFAKALETYDEARETFERTGERKALCRVLAKIATAESASGAAEQARSTFERADRICRAEGDQEAVAFIGGRLADLLRETDDLEAAVIQLRANIESLRALDRPRVEAYNAITLSRLLLELERPQEAQRWAEHGLSLHQRIANPWGETSAWDDVARARYAAGDTTGALEASQEGIARLERQRSRVNDPEKRATFLAANFATAATRREILLAEHRRRPDAGFAERALDSHENHLARALLDHLHETPAAPDAYAFDLSRMQARLDARSRLVEYALGEERSWAWVVGPDELQLIELAGRATISAAVDPLLADIGANGSGLASPAKRKALTDLIWQPLMDAVGPASRLLIVADGALRRVPFAALVDTSGGSLVEGFELTFSPSAAVALTLDPADRQPAGSSVHVVADPVYRADDPRLSRQPAPPPPESVLRATEAAGIKDLPRLRFSRVEADTLSELAGKGAVRQVDFEASKSALLGLDQGASGHVLHIAAHTLINDRDPQLSGIVLSLFDRQGRPRDGFLRLNEIQPLELDFELVVLSACSTSLGKDLPGEGLLSLTRSFLAAGARGVIASLWPVDDRATAELMTRFYTALWQGQRPAAALREAQRQMAAEARWSEPHYWAGFVYQGGLG